MDEDDKEGRKVEWLMCSYGEVDMLEKDDSLESARGTVTQSGSSDGTKGLGCRLGLSIVEVEPSMAWGGVTPD